MQLPSRVAHRGNLSPTHSKDYLVRASCIRGQERKNIPSVKGSAWGCGDIREFQHRGEKIHNHRWLGAHVARRNFPRPACEERNPVSTFVRASLHAAQPTRAATEHCAIVACEHYKRLFIEAKLL
jgi:hypothetical protein